ncbi:MAG: phosphate regulon transcriptional regulator PhoB [Moraxella sp.]|nr:phosphate regulon transcriptional regulator PhoB [Moraxella sp.]
MNEPLILVVEDEPAISEMIVTTLDLAGFRTAQAENAKEAYAMIVADRPDLVLLDWMLPDGQSGMDLCVRLKKEESTSEVPIIMLTAKGEETNKVQGLEAGADDYVAKPFSTKELIARIKAVLRRTSVKDTPLQVGGLLLEPASQRVTVKGEVVEMSATEYRLLAFFMSHEDRVYTRAQLLDRVWGSNVYIDERTIDVHIRRLRRLLAPYGVDEMIQTVRGTGYRFSQR